MIGIFYILNIYTLYAGASDKLLADASKQKSISNSQPKSTEKQNYDTESSKKRKKQNQQKKTRNWDVDFSRHKLVRPSVLLKRYLKNSKNRNKSCVFFNSNLQKSTLYGSAYRFNPKTTTQKFNILDKIYSDAKLKTLGFDRNENEKNLDWFIERISKSIFEQAQINTYSKKSANNHIKKNHGSSEYGSNQFLYPNNGKIYTNTQIPAQSKIVPLFQTNGKYANILTQVVKPTPSTFLRAEKKYQVTLTNLKCFLDTVEAYKKAYIEHGKELKPDCKCNVNYNIHKLEEISKSLEKEMIQCVKKYYVVRKSDSIIAIEQRFSDLRKFVEYRLAILHKTVTDKLMQYSDIILQIVATDISRNYEYILDQVKGVLRNTFNRDSILPQIVFESMPEIDRDIQPILAEMRSAVSDAVHVANGDVLDFIGIVFEDCVTDVSNIHSFVNDLILRCIYTTICRHGIYLTENFY